MCSGALDSCDVPILSFMSYNDAMAMPVAEHRSHDTNFTPY